MKPTTDILKKSLLRPFQWLIACLILAVMAPQPLPAQNAWPKMAAFIAQLRAVDLNRETQNGYAITPAEYQQLNSAWQELELIEKIVLLHSSEEELGMTYFAATLFIDLANNEPWEVHFRRMDALGARGLSLTLSRGRTRVRLIDARQCLVDLLQQGTRMLQHDKLVLPEALKAEAEQRAGKSARRRIEAWEKQMNNHNAHATWDKLNAVNLFFNDAITMQDDDGSALGCDYWQSPLETLARSIGDCDDFAMAKYVSLRLLGFPPEQLRVAVVMYPRVSGHAVLLFCPSGEIDPWVLDNVLTAEHGVIRKSEILRLSQRMRLHGLKPAFGINEEFWTVFEAGLIESRQLGEPRHRFRKFGVALLNSQGLLP